MGCAEWPYEGNPIEILWLPRFVKVGLAFFDVSESCKW